MKHGFLYIIAIIFAAPLWSQNDTANIVIDTTSAVYANVMYDKGDFAGAAQKYTSLIAKNGPSAELYYNLGNCYYKLNKSGPAILNYERALELDPGDEDIQYNLDLANLRIKDKIEPVNEMILLVWWRWFIKLFTLHTWSIVSVLLIWAGAAGFALYRISDSRRLQRNGFYVAAISFILFLISITATISRSDYDRHYTFGVIMAPSSIVKSEPSEAGTNLFLIHEGLKIQLLHPQENWTEIKMPDGNVGWIKNSDIEKI